jgi:hypothetical protein
MEHFLILAWLGDLLRDKKINQREHVILDYLGRQPEPVELMQFKKLAWYKEMYRAYSNSSLFSHSTNFPMRSFISICACGGL